MFPTAGLFDSAETTIVFLLPPLTSNTREAPENIIGINVPLYRQKSVVVLAPKGMLPVWLERKSLGSVKQAFHHMVKRVLPR